MTMGDAVSGLRIGHGYDAHRLVSGRRMYIAGQVWCLAMMFCW